MSTENPIPTIAELWDRFQKLGNYIETEKFLQSWGTKGSDGLSHDGRNHSSDEIELQSLRQQLLEKCQNEPSYLDAHFAGTMAEYHKEMSAIHAFKAYLEA